VHCGQTVAWIKMKLGMQLGLGPGQIVSWGPSSPPSKGHSPPIFGCMDQDVTWYGARSRPRRLCVKWGPRSPLPKMGAEPPFQFSAHLYCGQTARCIKMPLGMDVGLSPGDYVLDGDPILPPQQRGRSPLPIFGPFLLCPNGWMHQDATRHGGRPHPRRVCVRWGRSPLPKSSGSPLSNFKGLG